MKPTDIEDLYELSPLQQGILFHCLEAPDPGVYLITLCYALRGRLDLPAFARAWQRTVDRNPVLRTSFHWEDINKPLQVVHRRVHLPCEELDWHGLAPEEQESRLSAFLERERVRGFAMDRPPLMRLTLIRTGEDRHRLIWTFHHVLFEGWSASLLLQEVFAHYRGLRRGEEVELAPRRPYRDYILWLQQRELSRAEAYWRRTLEGFSSPTPLPLARPAAWEAGQELYASQRLSLPASTSAALASLARLNGLTLNTVLQGAWAVLLSRYSGEEDVLFGSVVSGRQGGMPDAESMVGLFVNTLPARVAVRPEAPVLAWLRELQDRQAEMREYEWSPLLRVQGWSDVPRGTRLFESIFAFENWLGDVSLQGWAEELQVEEARLIEGGTDYPLLVTAGPGTQVSAVFTYSRRRLDDDSVARLVRHYGNVLQGIVDRPDGRVSELPLMEHGERSRLLVEWNYTGRDWPRVVCLHELFEAQVERTPDLAAVSFEGRTMSYRELNSRANRLAHHLRDLGVGPEVRVGICMDRSLEMVVGLLGILKAGGAYVPLDPSYPEAQLAFVLSDAEVPVLLVQERLEAGLPAHQARVVRVDAAWDSIARKTETNPAVAVSPSGLAYAIYTSGSTGRPKGAMNTHAAVCNRLQWMQEEYGLGEGDRVVQKTPFSFDVSVWEFFWPLMTGARLVLARPEGHKDAAYLVDLMEAEGVTTAHFVPSMLRAFLEEPDVARLTGLRRVICSGEALSYELQERFFTRLGAELHNLYGPTEAAVDVTSWSCRRGDERRVVPIGRPIANTRAYVVDERLCPVPIGALGELYLGGVQVGRGYLKRPDLTAEKFVPDLFGGEPGARLYRTGDLARHLEDGSIEYVGRIDHQVKVRGYRIELGEIEAVLASHAGVREVVVVARQETTGDKRLVAYVVGEAGAEDLRAYLKGKLPDHMVPSAFVTLERLPLSPNGKVDRRALPAPERTREQTAGEYVAPRTSAEQTLAGIWASTLGVERVGIHDNFFALGGDSILSMRIVSRARQAGLALSAMQLFRHQTIVELAASSDGRSVRAEQGLVTGSMPLTPIQRWFFEQELLDPHHFNQAFLFEAPARLDAGRLEAALQALLLHHDALRLRFRPAPSGWRPEIVPPEATFPLSRVDLSALGEAEQAPAIVRSASELQASLDLSQGPLARAALLELGADRPQRLLVVIHHLAVDGVSWRILLEDLETAYGQLGRGLAVRLPAKTTSIKAWAERLTEHARSPAVRAEASAWQEVLGSRGPRLPVDHQGGENAAESARAVTVSLDPGETRCLLREVPVAWGAEINDVLLAALGFAFAAWTGESSILVDVEGHGREEIGPDADVTRTVGWFTSLFPVRLELVGAATPMEALEAVKLQLRRIPSRGIGYGLLRYLGGEVEIADTLRRVPGPDVSFNYLGQFDESLTASPFLRLARESSGPWRSSRGRRSHLLDVSAVVLRGALHTTWTYGVRIHRRRTIDAVARRYLEALRILVRAVQEARGGRPVSSSSAVERPELEDALREVEFE